MPVFLHIIHVKTQQLNRVFPIKIWGSGLNLYKYVCIDLELNKDHKSYLNLKNTRILYLN